MSEPWMLGIAEAGARLRDGSTTAVALATACLDRADAVDARLHAVLTPLREAALADAAALDHALAAGRDLGPLHGIPVGLKDIYDTAGVRTTCHSALLEHNVPAADAHSVARLREAGAVITAKLSTHEFAFGGPSPDLPWPAARNPWNPEHAPGGSSSGSGAAVAAGYCMAAMGSDTGGSIRSPAGLCGTVGLKPSTGLVSKRGIFPLSWTQDTAGPLTRSVEDCALVMDALAGHDPLDPGSVLDAASRFHARLAMPLAGRRIGFVRAWHDGHADDDTCAVLEAAAGALSAAGLEVVDVTLPDIQHFHACGRLVILSEAYAIHRGNLATRPQDYGQHFRDRVRLGAFVGASDYVDALRLRRQLADATLAAMDAAGVDALLCANQYGPGESFAESSGRTFHFFGKPSLTMPFNVTGMPALTVCGGFAGSGLPIGVQLAARPFDDALLMTVGHALERERGPLERLPEL